MRRGDGKIMIYQVSRPLDSLQGEIRPFWADQSEAGREIYGWLLSKQDPLFWWDNSCLSRLEKRIFSILYHSGCETGSLGSTGKLAGIFNHVTHELTDVSAWLQGILKAKEYVFRCKSSVKPELEEAVNRKLMFYLEHSPGKFYELGRDILPVVSRDEVEHQARRLHENGMFAVDVCFEPEYSFEDVLGRFPDQVYLLYLEAGERVIDAVTLQWIKMRGTEIYRKKILYSCIQESLAELERKEKRIISKNEKRAKA